METGLNASACVGKQPIMVATASTEHPIGCCLPGFHPNATQATQAIAFGWKPGITQKVVYECLRNLNGNFRKKRSVTFEIGPDQDLVPGSMIPLFHH